MLFFSTWQKLGIVFVGLGYGSALITKQIEGITLIPLGLLFWAASLIQSRRTLWNITGHGLFILVGFLLGIHWFPGFHNLKIMDAVVLTPNAVPFTLYLNFDKALTGFWVLLAWPGLQRDRPASVYLPYGIAIGLLTAFPCIGIALSFGLIDWCPKWVDQGWIFLLNNLLVIMVEETFFRGYLQEGLQQLLIPKPYGFWIALILTSLLFGLVHLGGGWSYVLMATVAGVGYGLAYRKGGLQSAILAHFTLNTIHFTLFTYPMAR